MEDGGLKRPALLEIWQQPATGNCIVWRTRRHGFVYQIVFEEEPTYQAEGLFERSQQPITPTVTCRKRVELDAIAAHYQSTLEEAGYNRVHSVIRGGRFR